uniref:Chromosome 1 open reading frame 43 n=1 Tax=Sphenodon punctatus TaxID=8508 RepID=A0A8D0G7C5_SPHPU
LSGGGAPWSCVKGVLSLSGGGVFVLLFIFVKRQIVRFAMKSRRGPHVLVGQHAPKELKEEIDIRLSRVHDIKYEPQLLAEDDVRLLQLEMPGGGYNYLYRMKALDAIRTAEIPFSADDRHPKSLIGKNFRAFLLELRNASSPFKGIRKSLLSLLLDGYDNYLKYQEALSELAAILKARGGSSQRQHQSAAKDLTLSPEPSKEQARQALPGAEELQGQLQHAGEHAVTAWQCPLLPGSPLPLAPLNCSRRGQRLLCLDSWTGLMGLMKGLDSAMSAPCSIRLVLSSPRQRPQLSPALSVPLSTWGGRGGAPTNRRLPQIVDTRCPGGGGGGGGSDPRLLQPPPLCYDRTAAGP